MLKLIPCWVVGWMLLPAFCACSGRPPAPVERASVVDRAPDAEVQQPTQLPAQQPTQKPTQKSAVDDSPRARLLASITAAVPKLSREDTYVSSKACASCHPKEHDSWYRTYHRTMTQLALPENVLSDFQDTVIESAGLKYRVYRKGDEFWAEMPDPDRMLDMSRGDPTVVPEQLPRVHRRVLMTTGSHHYQTYWVGHEKLDSILNTLPLVYLPGRDRWIPREAAFIMPPDEPFRMITIWNDHCINCHSTGGNPGLAGPKTLNTSVGELGIACEACHGPGENHVAHHKGDPLNPDSTSQISLVHPAKLDHRRSSQICGQCHGVFIRVGEHGLKFAREGIQFRPGEDLHAKRFYVEFPDANASGKQREAFLRNREFFRERWWDDGTMLAGGREYSAMLRSPCYIKGEISCLACHSMHDSDPDDQLARGMRGNQACTQCHTQPQFTTNLQSHTHHQVDSEGSKCMNCHMPHTSYALFSSIRNHTISSPTVANSVEHGVPNACNLCHLDKTLSWTQAGLSDWYGQDQARLTAEHRTTSAAVLWALRGHAAQRVTAAWHFGWKPAQDASSKAWIAPVVSQLLADPYGVIRHVAERSVKTLPEAAEINYDFLGSSDHREAVIKEILGNWSRGRASSQSPRVDPRNVLLTPDGTLMETELKRLLDQRDDRPTSIKE